MTRRAFAIVFLAVVLAYVLLVALAFIVRICWPDSANGAPSWQYATYKDVLPLLIAIPAAWLAFSTQRRLSYLQQLRLLWTKLVDSVQGALEYIDLVAPSQTDHKKTLRLISTAIDEVRPLFRNLGETKRRRGGYPFDAVKDIYIAVQNLPPESFTADATTQSRSKVLSSWQYVQRYLLPEFDRQEPTLHDPYYI